MKNALKKKPARTSAPVDVKKLPRAGTLYGGGIVVGPFFLVDTPFLLIAALPTEGECNEQQYHSTYDRIKGANHYYDGLANTEAMAKASSATAKWARGLHLDGKDDWYVLSRGEALLADAAQLKGPHAFQKRWYWTSTQHASDSLYAWVQSFSDGTQTSNDKDIRYSVRAVRREPIKFS